MQVLSQLTYQLPRRGDGDIKNSMNPQSCVRLPTLRFSLLIAKVAIHRCLVFITKTCRVEPKQFAIQLRGIKHEHLTRDQESPGEVPPVAPVRGGGRPLPGQRGDL